MTGDTTTLDSGKLLLGRIAVITGSSRGIGRAIALCFAQQGADIVVNGHDRTCSGEEVAGAIRHLGRKAIFVRASVAEAEGARLLIDSAKGEFGRVDILVNNAGITRDNFLMTMPEADWDDVMDTNLKSMFLCCRNVSKLMVAQRSGVIVNISSLSGFVGMRGQTNYSASKLGIVGFTKSLAQELAHWNIRVNVVAPGWIRTELTEPVDEDVMRRYPVLMRRLGRPEEVANCALFLASDLSSYITGATLHVNGGLPTEA